MIRILHISDLHFAEAAIQPKLKELQEALKESLRIDADIEVANQSVLDALSALIGSTDPDVLIISGDVTTFGDEASYSAAHEWLLPLLMRKGGEQRTCLVVPGNHDVLSRQFAQLVREHLENLPWYARAGVKRYLRRPLKILEELLPSGQGATVTDLFTDFRNFAEKPGISSQRVVIDLGSDSRLVIHPFCTTGTDPIWMNIGEARGQEIDRLRADLAKDARAGKGQLHVVVMHHNPISSSAKVETNLVNAYNSMPAGPQLMHTLQTDGVDLILHGHQHEDAKLLFDFDFESAGHAYAFGSLSSAAPNGGCNLLEIHSINSGTVATYRYTPRSRRFEFKGEPLPLGFERNRPSDAKTTETRLEIKKFSWLETDEGKGQELLWNEVQSPGASMVYISGRHLVRMAQDRSSQDLSRLLKDDQSGGPKTYLRILISNPELMDALSVQAGSVAPSGGVDAKLWGTAEELDNVARTARQSLEHLKSFVSNLSDEERARVDVRVSHTILPFAASVRDADKDWGKMVVRLLPVGAIGGITAPVLKLNRRADGALYDYYLRHFKALLGRGSSVLGEWNKGDSDLVVEGLPKPNKSRSGADTTSDSPN
jgi:3',5'-cyclic AMP phosphodiesterase CpdA